MYNNLYDHNNQNYNLKNENGPQDNYSGKANRAHHNYQNKNNVNNNIQNNNNYKYDIPNNKIKIITFKNGFMINDEEFRDKSIPKNRKFMEEVDKGMIPEELLLRDIGNMEITFENRKNEIFINQTNPTVNPLTSAIKSYLHENKNQNINTNKYQNINQQQSNNNKYSNVTINPPPKLQDNNHLNQYHPQHYHQQQNQYQNQYIYNEGAHTNRENRGEHKRKRQRIEITNNCVTPIGTRNTRRNLFEEKNEKKNEKNNKQNLRKSISEIKKKEEKKFHTFASLIKGEKLKEEEEKKKKKNKTNKNEEEEKEDKKSEEKKFTAFTGSGKIIKNINTQGLHIDRDVKMGVNRSLPICSISIRLFNGEIIKSEFNCSQTLRDIYLYVQRISGSNNFALLDGFPPKPLKDFNKTIEELKLENTILTQKIN